MGRHFDDDVAGVARAEDMKYGWDVLKETGVHYASPHGLDHPRR
jgi:hypothetical protein